MQISKNIHKKGSLGGNLMLLLTACIWGTGFVAQSVGADYVGPFTFNGLRTILGSLVLLPVIFFLDCAKEKAGTRTSKTSWRSKELWIGGLLCGLALLAGSQLQQIAIQHTTVGKAGFITTLYIVLVPVLGVFLKHHVSKRTWISVAIAVVGSYFLCITSTFTISQGDLLMLLCAIFFSIHILLIDHYSPKVDSVKMSCIQFFVCGTLALIGMVLWETPIWSDIMVAWFPIVYAGIFSCGIAYTLQVVAQKTTDPTIASLILCLESVIAVLAGWLLLGETLSLREGLGCILVFIAIIYTQLPEKQPKENL
ncbi:MAG: DMT family transporter [Lachnospiraceae bacterium]